MPQFNSCLTNAQGVAQNGVPYIEYASGTSRQNNIVVPFPYQHEDDVCVYIENPVGTYTLQGTNTYSFGINAQNQNTISLNSATSNAIHIMRRTDVCDIDAQFEPGASIRAQDLNHDFTQLLYLVQENRRALSAITGHNGTLPIDPSSSLLWNRNGTTLEPVTVSDNLRIDGTTQFNGATYTWPSAVAGTSGQALTCSNTGVLSWTTVATGTSNVSEIETATGSGLMCGTKGSEATGTATGDVSIVIDTGDGLTINGNSLEVNDGDGLEFDSGALRVDLDGTTITRTANGISVTTPFDEPTGNGVFGRQSDGTWAAVNTGDVTGIDAGDGIRIDDANTATPEVNIRLAGSSGLEFTGANNDLRIDVNGGLELTANGINVNEITIWGQTLNMTSNVNGDLAMGAADITFTDNANTVTLGAPTGLNATYTLQWPVNAGADGNFLELQDASTGQMRWGTPTGTGTGGVVNQINANAGLSGGGSTADVDIAVELSANSGLQFSDNTAAGTLQVAANTGLSRNANGLNVDSINLWNNAHDHSGNIDGTIRLGEGNTLQFQEDSSGNNRIGTLETANLTANRTWVLPDEGGTLGLATAALWERVTGTPNVTRLSNSGDTLQVQSGSIRSVDTNITIEPGGTGNRNVEISSLNAGTIRLLDNTTIDATLNTTGAADFDSTLNVDGDTTLGGDLDVDGATTVDGLTSDGAVTVDGVLTIENANNLVMGTGSITATENIVLDPGGTGVVQVDSHLEVRNENALRLFDSGNTDAVRLKAANASATYEIEFPAASPAGADRVLQWNNTNSVFEWIATPTSAAGLWQRTGSNLTTFNADDTVTLNGHLTLDDASDATNTQFRIPDANRGTNALPNIAWQDNDGNFDTGFFQPNQNIIGVTTAGTERARFTNDNLTLQNSVDLVFTNATNTGTITLPAGVNANRQYDLPNAGGTIALVGQGGVDNRYVQLTPGNAEQTINSGTSADNLELVSTAAGATGATLTVRTDSASPADDDVVGRIEFEGDDDGGNVTNFARIDAIATDVTDTSEDGAIAFSTRNGANLTEKLRIDNVGRLLVGTQTSRAVPSESGTEANVQIETTSYLGFSIANNTNDGGGAELSFGKSRGNAVGGTTVVQNNDALGVISFNAADGTDLQSESARIAAEVDGVPGANDTPGRLVFSTTADGADDVTERMRLDSAGRLLIGQQTQTRTSKLNVRGNTGNTSGSGELELQRGEESDDMSNGDSIGLIYFNDNTNANPYATISARVDAAPSNTVKPGRLVFSTRDTAVNGSPIERMRIASDGRIILPANSPGIAFNANNTTSATVDSKSLDDYEEGTFDPVVTLGANNVAYDRQAGRYTKIGNQVYIDAYILFGNGVSSDGTTIQMNLPYAVSTLSYGSLDDGTAGQFTRGFGSISYSNIDYWINKRVTLYGRPGESAFNIYLNGENGTFGDSGTAIALKYVIFGFTYNTN